MNRLTRDHRRQKAAMLIASRSFLERLADTERRYHVSRQVRTEARLMLQGFPSLEELQRMAEGEYGAELAWTPAMTDESQP